MADRPSGVALDRASHEEIQAERAKFERSLTETIIPEGFAESWLKRTDEGDYSDPQVNEAWHEWRARAAGVTVLSAPGRDPRKPGTPEEVAAIMGNAGGGIT